MTKAFFRYTDKLRRDMPPQGGEAAVEALQALGDEAPAGPAAAFQLGELWLGLGRTSEARRWLAEALKRAPTHLPASVFLALAFSDEGDLSAARRQVDGVLARRPDHEFAAALRDYFDYLEEKSPEAAARLAKSPFVYDQHLGGRLLFHVERRQLQQSKARLADLFAEVQVSFLGRWMYPIAQVGRHVKAALQHPFNGVRRREALAVSEGLGLLAVGRPAEAARRVREATRGAPSSPEVGFLMAEALLAGGELTRLGELLAAMKEKDAGTADTPEFSLFAGVLLAERGEYREAAEVLSGVPDDRWNFFPYYYRGLAATGLNRPVEARRWFARALEICTIQLVHRRLRKNRVSA
ncbi:tetratricopeptide repeat protein [bacterium]|nr:tetratricopeptide repeat protein [bacterium]